LDKDHKLFRLGLPTGHTNQPAMTGMEMDSSDGTTPFPQPGPNTMPVMPMLGTANAEATLKPSAPVHMHVGPQVVSVPKQAWVGTVMNRLWLKSEGFFSNSTVSDGDHEALYDRPIPHMRYFDAQVGVRADLDSGPRRAWAAVGIEGLAPYFFQFAPTLYIRDGGNVAGRLTGSYDLLLTQRWIVQPEAEVNFYSKDDPGRGIGSGLSDLDTGVRLRYEISRKFTPYIGFAYSGKYGNTNSYSRQAGESTSDPRFVFGLRLWY
jgi:copper resistance protein B